MQTTLRRIKSMVLRSAALLTIIICGCDTATVYVSHPQVFTRERLVVSRQRDLQFLYTQLDKPIATGYQGAIDERLLTAFQAGVAANISPNPSAASQPSPPLNFANLAMPAATTQNTASNVMLSSVDRFTDAMAYRDAVNAVIREKELDDTHDLSGHTLYTLKFDSAILPGENSKRPAIVIVKLSGLNSMSDEDKWNLYLSWVHYMDQMRTTQELALFARVASGEPSNMDMVTTTEFLSRAVTDLEDELKKQPAVPSNPPKDWNAEIKAIGDAIHDDTFDYIEGSQEQKRALFSDPPGESPADKITRAFKQQCVARGFWYGLEEKYRAEFPKMFTIQHTAEGRDGNGMLLIFPEVVPVANDGPAPPEFSSGLRLPATAKGQNSETILESDLYIDSVDPQEYAQNISDVSNTNKLLSFSLQVAAMLGNSASLNAAGQYLAQTQKLLQAIKRNPLAIGFGGGQSFGWLLGAPFVIENNEPDFIQEPGRQSFSVSFVAPVWLSNITCSANAWWLDDRGRIGKQLAVEGPGPNIRLPTDFSALTTALQYRNNGKRPPVVENDPASNWKLQSGSSTDQTLLIFGTDLWRNPEVFVDSKRADTVDLLPDMNGLLAHFTNVPVPTVPQGTATLRVVTSFGVATADQTVSLLSPANKAPSGPSAALARGYVVGWATGATVTHALLVAIDPASMPSAFAGFVLNIRPTGSIATATSIDSPLISQSDDKKTWSFTIPAQNDAAYQVPVPVTIDLRLKPNLFGEPVNLFAQTDPADRQVIYFPKEGMEVPILVSANPVVFDKTSGNYTSGSIIFGPATGVTMDNLYSAYPGLKNSITAGTAMLLLQDSSSGKPAVQLALSVANIDQNFSVSMTGLTATKLPYGKYDKFTVTFKPTSNNMPGTMPMALAPGATPAPLAVNPSP